MIYLNLVLNCDDFEKEQRARHLTLGVLSVHARVV